MNASSTLASERRTVRAENWGRKKRGAEDEKDRPSDGVFSRICHRRWTKKTTTTTRRGAAAVNSRPIKRTDKLLSEKLPSSRHSVSRITRCQMPIIFTRRWQLRHAARTWTSLREEKRRYRPPTNEKVTLEFRRNASSLSTPTGCINQSICTRYLTTNR